MAPFNKRQIGYIQAVAGRQQHTTLRAGSLNRQLKSTDTAGISDKGGAFNARVTNKLHDVQKAIGGMVTTESSDPDAKHLLVHTWQLDRTPLAFDSRAEHNNNTLTAADFTNLRGVWVGMGHHTDLAVFDARCATQATLSNGTPNASADITAGGVGLAASDVTGTTSKFDLNQDQLASTVRASPDGYLHSTNITFRFTLPGNVAGSGDVSSLMPTAAQLGIDNTNSSNGITPAQYEQFTKGLATNADDGTANATRGAIQSLINQYNIKHPMGQDHYEFRWIVWRNKRPTFHRWGDTSDTYSNMDAIRDGFSLRNPAYDLFVGQTGRKRGFLGYTLNANLDQNNQTDEVPTEKYSGANAAVSIDQNYAANGSLHPTDEAAMTVDDLLTMRLNRDDYVVMKDVRFFLGKEHGKSHFEDTLHWDWNDPIDTPNSNVLSSPTLNNKNFRWNMTLIATSGGKNPVVLNECVRWTTKMTSG